MILSKIPKKSIVTFILLLALTLLIGGAICCGSPIAYYLGMLYLVPVILGITLIGLWPGLLFICLLGLADIYYGFQFDAESIEGLFRSPFVSILPRVLVVLIAWGIHRLSRRLLEDGTISAKVVMAGMNAALSTILHIVFVLVSIRIVYPVLFGDVDEIDSVIEQAALLTEIVSSHSAYTFLATVVCVSGAAWLYHRHEKTDKSRFSMSHALRKWILLALSGMALLIVASCFMIDTVYEYRYSCEVIEEVLDDISSDFDEMSQKNPYRDILYKIGQRGHTFLVRDNEIVTFDQTMPEPDDAKDRIDLDEIQLEDHFTLSLMNHKWLGHAKKLNNGMILVGMLPDFEIHATRNRTILELIMGLMFIIAMICVVLNIIIRNNVTQNVRLVRNGLAAIRDGELETRLDIGDNLEFRQISDDINDTVQSLQDAKTEVERHIQADLDLARNIQGSALPDTSFSLSECTISASMVPAREVGGDFYDYFVLPNRRLGIVIADVSGKGIPAAMFMMKAKTLIKDISANCDSPAHVLTKANEQLCDNNDAGMFVTAFLGWLDLNTAKLMFANAGHNPVVWMHQNTCEFLDHKRYRRGLMLGGMPTVKYRDNEIQLAAGDKLVLYTDGITESCSPAQELYGDQRLLDTLQPMQQLNASGILEALSRNVLDFEAGTDPADDKTILVLDITMKIQSIKLNAETENTQKFLDFVEETLESMEVPLKFIQKFMICTDEIVSNIVQYSKASEAEIVCRKIEERVSLVFRDNGTPYNPLDRESPDTTLPLEERGVGGYGIHIVRKMMDDVDYCYVDGNNCLEIALKVS